MVSANCYGGYRRLIVVGHGFVIGWDVPYVQMTGWLGGWMVGWMVGWMDGWMAGWKARCLDGWLAGWFDGLMA